MKKYVRSNTDMTDQEIREFISTEFLNKIQDYEAQTVLRRVLYYPGNVIDWQDFYLEILMHMPEYSAPSRKLRNVRGSSICSSEVDDYGEDEHIPTLIDNVKKGDFFKLSDKPNGKVYVKDEYDRSEKAYWCYEYYDVNSGRFFKKGKKVYVGFTF